MTTDITELAQRARINAECGEHLSPAETMELVEALESEKRICATWRKTAKSTGEKLETAQGMEAYWKTQCRGIADHCEELQARIAELESRTVTATATAAAADALAERKRQVTTEGWTPEHDDEYDHGE